MPVQGTTTNVWTNLSGDGDWNNPLNWSLNQVPTTGQLIQIGVASPGPTVNVPDGASVALYGSTTNYGVIAVNSTGDTTNFIIDASLNLSGGGVVQLSDSSANRIYSNNGGTQFTNVDNTIEGSGQIFSSYGNLSIVNDAQGKIDASGKERLTRRARSTSSTSTTSSSRTTASSRAQARPASR